MRPSRVGQRQADSNTWQGLQLGKRKGSSEGKTNGEHEGAEEPREVDIMDSHQRQARVTRPHIGGGEGRGLSEDIQQDFRLRTGRGDFSKATQLVVSYFPCLSKQILDRR